MNFKSEGCCHSNRIFYKTAFFLDYLIASISPGNLRSQTSRSPHISAMAWDKLSPVKTVGMATSVPSSQASPALVNALFERVEEQAEVRTFTLERLRFTFTPNDKCEFVPHD